MVEKEPPVTSEPLARAGVRWAERGRRSQGSRDEPSYRVCIVGMQDCKKAPEASSAHVAPLGNIISENRPENRS